MVYWLFLACLWCQQVVQLGIVALILWRGGAHGPELRARLYLAAATVLTSVNVLPPTVWQYYLPKGCAFYVGSWVDFLLLLDTVSFIFFFLFLRDEYLRNREVCMYTSVSQIHDTHSFKRF